MSYKEVKGDLIKLALEGEFDVIGHGCNCFCTMKKGIAVEMAKVFACDDFTFEGLRFKGNIAKLGTIDYMHRVAGVKPLIVVNMYTQYNYRALNGKAALNYEALTSCLRQINLVFHNKKIGLPQIGAGLAGGDWDKIKQIIQQELKDCDTTVVIYEQPKR